MSGSFESVQWNACVQRLDLGLHSNPKEFLGNGVRTRVNFKRQIPSIGGKNLLRGESNPRRCIKQDSEPNTLPTELFRPPFLYVYPFSVHADTFSVSLRLIFPFPFAYPLSFSPFIVSVFLRLPFQFLYIYPFSFFLCLPFQFPYAYPFSFFTYILSVSLHNIYILSVSLHISFQFLYIYPFSFFTYTLSVSLAYLFSFFTYILSVSLHISFQFLYIYPFSFFT